MVEAEQVQDRGVQVVHRADVFDGVHAEFVGRAVDRAPFDSAAGQPDREAFGVMVAAVAAGGVRRAAELAGPDDQRFVEQAAGFQSWIRPAIA